MPTQKSQYIPYLAIGLVSMALFLIQTVAVSKASDLHLAFSREGLLNYQFWRLLSGHLLHTNFIHLMLNTFALWLLWMLHGDYSNYRNFFLNFVLLSLGISSAIWLFSPNIHWYVGLSGVLHGMFVWGCIIDISKQRKTGYLLLIGICIKLYDEQINGASTMIAEVIEANVAIDAHLYGAIIGVFLGLAYLQLHKKR